jgi:hypothetical protein
MDDKNYDDGSLGRSTTSSPAHDDLIRMAKTIAESLLSVFSAEHLSQVAESIDSYLTAHAQMTGYDRRYVPGAGYTWFPISMEAFENTHPENQHWPKAALGDPDGLATAFANEHYPKFQQFLQKLYKENEGIALAIVLAVLIQRASKEPAPLGPSPIGKAMEILPTALRVPMHAALYGATSFDASSRGGQKGAGRAGRETGGTDEELTKIAEQMLVVEHVNPTSLNSTIRARHGNKFGGERHLRARLTALGHSRKTRKRK